MYVLATLVQLLFWGGVFGQLARYRVPAAGAIGEQAPVSVVVCARDEAENLRKNLPLILSQNYRSFEIIAVNDHSEDKTWEVLLEFQESNPNFTAVNATGVTRPGKKAALSLGIEAAQYETVLLTDADCRPATDQWIELMQGALGGDIEIGLGYGPHLSTKGFLSTLTNFETVYTATQYLSFSLVGSPYMGVGRNLIYRKRLFHQVGGFQDHAHFASGDDDLFVNQIANARNTRIVLQPAAFVYSAPKTTWLGYYYQKSRHFTTGSRYRPVHQLALGALSSSHLGHYAALAALLCMSSIHTSATISLYLVRMVVVCIVYRSVLVKLRAPQLLLWTPLLDGLYILYYLLFAPALFTGSKHKRWK